MDWIDIVFELLEDDMIKCRGTDGLYDAYLVLNGLFGMSETMNSYEGFNDDFILEAINSAIKARNHYCFLNGEKDLPLVKLINNDFIWDK